MQAAMFEENVFLDVVEVSLSDLHSRVVLVAWYIYRA